MGLKWNPVGYQLLSLENLIPNFQIVHLGNDLLNSFLSSKVMYHRCRNIYYGLGVVTDH